MTTKIAIACLKAMKSTHKSLEMQGINSDVPMDEESIEALDMAISALKERPKGEWIHITNPLMTTQIFHCNCCGRHIEIPEYEVSTLTIRYPFCHCGAEMQKGGEW